MRLGWFGPKRLGWGASPRTWEGWLVTIVMVAAFAAYARYASPLIADELGVSRPVATLAGALVWFGLLVLIVRATYSSGK